MLEDPFFADHECLSCAGHSGETAATGPPRRFGDGPPGGGYRESRFGDRREGGGFGRGGGDKVRTIVMMETSENALTFLCIATMSATAKGLVESAFLVGISVLCYGKRR